jgi:hypothetical protein
MPGLVRAEAPAGGDDIYGVAVVSVIQGRHPGPDRDLVDPDHGAAELLDVVGLGGYVDQSTSIPSSLPSHTADSCLGAQIRER